MSLTIQILILIVLLFLSGVSSGSEVALVSLSKSKVRHMLDRKERSAIYIKKLKDDPHRMLGTILILNNLVNVAAASFTTVVMIGIFDNYAIGAATGIMTLLILIFGEITPKTIAAHNNKRIAKLVSPSLWYLSIIFYPFLFVLEKIIKVFMKLFGFKTEEAPITEEEIISLVKEAEDEGSIRTIERNLIANIFDFDDMFVSEIATQKENMVLIKANASVKEAMKAFLRDPHSRIPVYQGSKENIVGIMMFKDILRNHDHPNTKVRNIMKKPYYVQDHKRISNLLRHFQKRKEHMAIVIDEKQHVTGLVTLEDVLEEIVGEIMDEKDKVEPNINKVTRNVWNVLGNTDIEELNEKLKMGIKTGDYTTLSEFILDIHGKMPKENKTIYYRKFSMKVTKRKGQTIENVRVEKG
ncbi:MAG: hemolysin family protein [Candidatus Woesearchaeota archaeon]|jgi:CBS domain containing-hemolysin-like protein|nr:hemolysin family protein [Candidatus Woesearchaeota archaeon]MDP7457141.1 hemolysin family protein [Candidatus Woesearchaeota archaeon]